MRYLAVPLALLVSPLAAETVAPIRAIRAQEVIAAGDLELLAADYADTYGRVEEVAGLEARVALYPGRPVKRGDVGPPAVIARNQIVPLVYESGGVAIRTEARALDRAGAGDFVRAMNLSSRMTVTGRVLSDGSILVAAAEAGQ